ncbi:MAG: LuxR family transcriptional regulator, partial [Nocardioides sp.]|nr:LuxR family transcriptional regulator [Nocardioides sp.]
MTERSDRESRALFEAAGNEIYEAVTSRGGLPIEDAVFTQDAETAEATTMLLEMGLLTCEGGRYHAADPHTAQASVVGPLGQQGAAMIHEASQWSQLFAGLGQTYRRSPATEDGPITRLVGPDQIERFLADVVPHAQAELLTAQPQAGRSAATLKIASERDVSALQRGVSMRTIYQHAARRSRATRAYVARVTEHGGEVRTLDEFFNRLIVVDREVAVIPSGDDLKVALAIRDVALV